MSSINGASRPLNVEAGMIGRVAKYGMEGAAGGAVVGAVGGSVVPGIGTGLGLVGGGLLGAVAGIAAGMKSGDPDKLQNRPLKIQDYDGSEKTVFISAQQFKDLAAAKNKGITFDNLPSPMDEQLSAPMPAPVKP